MNELFDKSFQKAQRYTNKTQLEIVKYKARNIGNLASTNKKT